MRRPARAQGAASCAPSHLVGGAPLPTSTQRRRRRRCGLRAPAGGREGRPPSPRRTWRRAQVVPDAASLKVVHKDVIIPRRHMPLSTGGGHERAAPAFNERGASPKSHRHLTENQESLRVLKAAKVTGCCLLWHAEALSCWRGVRAAPTHQARRRRRRLASAHGITLTGTESVLARCLHIPVVRSRPSANHARLSFSSACACLPAGHRTCPGVASGARFLCARAPATLAGR